MKYLIPLLLCIVVVAQEVPYEDVAPELRPVDAFGEPLIATVGDVVPLTANDIGKLERDLEAAKFRYLTEHGWIQNPDNPGSLWLWSRTVGARDYRLETDVALNIEFALEPPTDEQLIPVEPETP